MFLKMNQTPKTPLQSPQPFTVLSGTQGLSSANLPPASSLSILFLSPSYTNPYLTPLNILFSLEPSQAVPVFSFISHIKQVKCLPCSSLPPTFTLKTFKIYVIRLFYLLYTTIRVFRPPYHMTSLFEYFSTYLCCLFPQFLHIFSDFNIYTDDLSNTQTSQFLDFLTSNDHVLNFNSVPLPSHRPCLY